MVKYLTQIIDFPTRIPDSDDNQPYLPDQYLSSNPESCTIASHPPLGKSDHMVVSVDVNVTKTKLLYFNRHIPSFGTSGDELH